MAAVAPAVHGALPPRRLVVPGVPQDIVPEAVRLPQPRHQGFEDAGPLRGRPRRRPLVSRGRGRWESNSGDLCGPWDCAIAPMAPAAMRAAPSEDEVERTLHGRRARPLPCSDWPRRAGWSGQGGGCLEPPGYGWLFWAQLWWPIGRGSPCPSPHTPWQLKEHQMGDFALLANANQQIGEAWGAAVASA